MFEVEFYYNGKNIIIQCNLNDKMKDIFIKYGIKLEKEIHYIFYMEVIN